MRCVLTDAERITDFGTNPLPGGPIRPQTLASRGATVIPKLSRTPGAHRRSAPDLGQDTDTALRELGLGAEQIAALRKRGIVSGPGNR